MLVGHIGEHAIEAIYEVRAGDNLGWSVREGKFLFRPEDRCHLYPLPDNDADYDYTYPVAAYDHDPPPSLPCNQDSGHAVSGGFVYRGRQVPQLKGKYVFGDIVDGRVFYTNEREMRRDQKPAPIYEFHSSTVRGKQLTMQELAGDKRVDLHFGSDGLGGAVPVVKGQWEDLEGHWRASNRPLVLVRQSSRLLCVHNRGRRLNADTLFFIVGLVLGAGFRTLEGQQRDIVGLNHVAIAVEDFAGASRFIPRAWVSARRSHFANQMGLQRSRISRSIGTHLLN